MQLTFCRKGDVETPDRLVAERTPLQAELRCDHTGALFYVAASVSGADRVPVLMCISELSYISRMRQGAG